MKTKMILVFATLVFSGAMYFLLTIDHLKWGISALDRKEYQRAFGYFVKAANQGNAEGAYHAAYMLQHAQGTEQNLDQAVQYYRQAAELNHAAAIYQLAVLEDKGINMPKNHAAAAKGFFKAAELGYAPAQYETGLILAEGRAGHSRDYKKAVEWYQKASWAGIADAQFNLAGMYQFGQGVNADPIEAYIWYSVSANFGRTDAVKIRDYVIAKRITSDQIETAHSTAGQRLAKIRSQQQQ